MSIGNFLEVLSRHTLVKIILGRGIGRMFRLRIHFCRIAPSQSQRQMFRNAACVQAAGPAGHVLVVEAALLDIKFALSSPLRLARLHGSTPSSWAGQGIYAPWPHQCLEEDCGDGRNPNRRQHDPLPCRKHDFRT